MALGFLEGSQMTKNMASEKESPPTLSGHDARGQKQTLKWADFQHEQATALSFLNRGMQGKTEIMFLFPRNGYGSSYWVRGCFTFLFARPVC